MVLFQARIPVAPESRAEVLRSLRGIVGETRARPGCLSCHLCTEVAGDAEALMLLEGWSDIQTLRDYVRSDSFRVVLSALDYARETPEVRFDTVADSRGMGFILACRQSGVPT